MKTSISIVCIGQRGGEIYETLTFESGDEMKLVSVPHKFSEYCNPRKKQPYFAPSFHIQTGRGSKFS